MFSARAVCFGAVEELFSGETGGGVERPAAFFSASLKVIAFGVA